MSRKPYGLELYINNLILEMNELYPNIITDEQKNRLFDKYINDPRIKTVEGFEEVKRIIKYLVTSYINKYYAAKKINKYNPQKWSDTTPTEEAKKIDDILEVLKEYGEKPLKILDAGCGKGKNSLYFAQKGYLVDAVDVDSNELSYLKDRTIDYHIENINIFNINVIDYLKMQKDNSLDVVIDSGMSNFLDDEMKYIFYQLVRRKLKAGGIYSMLHYAEFEGDNNLGRNISDLKKLTLGGEILVPWEEKQWHNDLNNIDIKTYSAIIRKANGNIPTEAIKYVLWLKGNDNIYSNNNNVKKNNHGKTNSYTIITIVTVIIMIIIAILLSIIL